jgi:hypothetical protein
MQAPACTEGVSARKGSWGSHVTRAWKQTAGNVCHAAVSATVRMPGSDAVELTQASAR